MSNVELDEVVGAGLKTDDEGHRLQPQHNYAVGVGQAVPPLRELTRQELVAAQHRGQDGKTVEGRVGGQDEEYKFKAWNKQTKAKFTEDTTITALYDKLADVVPGDQDKPNGYSTVVFDLDDKGRAPRSPPSRPCTPRRAD